jgi:hypothetical protein
LTAVNNGQTKITVSHSKSSNEKTIIAYVVNDVNELNNRVLLGLEKENYLLTAGDELALRLITNANDTQKSQINWAVDDISVLSLDQNGDVGFIRAVGAGTTKVTVTHPQNVIPLVIYISVSDALPGEKSIAVPSIIELLVGENKVVTAETLGLSGAEITAIRWSIDDESVASISNDGNKTYILGKSKGQAFVTCKLDSIGYSKKILLVCADTYEELENTYVMNSPETYYKINIGDIKNISLQFGSAGFPEAEKQNITWAAENNNVVRLVGNGDKGTFEGINAGIAKITVSSGIAFKAIEITVEVNAKEVAGESYAFSYTAMYGLVIGDTATVQVMINPAGAGYGLIEYENQDNAVVTVSQTGDGNEFFITAVGAGQTYLNLRHPKVVEPARILFYTAATQEALDNMFPISLAKTNYLVGIGETVRIKIDTPSDDAAKLNQVRWSLDNNGIVSYDVISKKEIEITGVTPGNCVFSISYNNEVVEKAYISVKSNTVLDGSKKIITESIVGMVKGQSKATAIVSNLNPTEIAALEWSSDSVSKVTVTPVAGDNVKATLTAVNTGETYVTVKLGDIKRRILVYVCDTQAQVDAYKAMNIDTQYYQLKRQEELTLSVFYAAAKPSVNAVWEDVYNNNVVEITAIGNKAQVKGINEGIATIKITNAQCVTPIYITVEVSNAFGGTVEENEELWYLSASKTIYVLNPDYPLETVSLQVNPVGFSEGELTNIKWEKKEGASLVQLYPAGASCTVAPGSGEGTAVLRVTHAKSSNYLEIRIIVTREPLIEEGMPYIAVAEEVIRVAMNGEAQVRMNLLDAASPDVSKFAATSNNGNVTVSVTGDMLTARGISYGQSLVTITHPDAQYPKKVVVIVTVTDDGILYLTTENNFSLIQRDDYKALEVALIGFEETNNNRFHWTADTAADGELVSINASGNKAVVTGKKVGTAKIKVTHDFCQYPLYVYARVTELGEVTPTYITTSNNIVSVKKGNSMQVLANLINGMEAEYSLFTWSTNNRDIIELNFSGNSALIRGLKSGTAGVTIAHPSSLNSITILVVVEEDTADSGIYIATDSQLVELKPTDASRHISVRLVGGSAEDIYGFQWQIVDYVSIVKNKDGTSRPVVTLVANADNAYVMPTSNEGEATIRVTHPKTSYRLDLKVMVQLTTQIVFEKTNLTMDMLTSQSVSLESPTGITVIYESSNDTVASVMGTDKVCIIEGHKAGTVVITARNASGTTSDEIVVKVNAVDTSHTEYISTSTNLLTLNTNMAPVTVSAKLVAATAPDTALLDTQYLVYTSDNTDVVSIYGSGSSVSVTPKGAGTAEITIKYINGNDPNFTTYPSLKNYVKRIYVKVEVDEMIFSISDTLLLMVEGEKATVTVKVDNVSDINYNNDISWVSSDSTVASVGKISSTTSGMAQIVALKEGTAVITATYKGSIRNCTVQVTKPKMFTISATSLDIAPGQTIPNEFDTVPIRLTLLPSTDKFTYSMDNYNCVDMQVSSDTDGATVTLTGRNVEGLTVITFTATSGLRCSLTVNNVRNYNLQWKNRSNLREDPYVDNNPLQEGRVEMYQGRRWYVMEYDIRPVTDTLSLVTPGGNFAEVAIDSTNKKVYIRPLTPGYQVLRFKGDVNQFQIELPIYFFYENIEPKWIFSRRENHDNKGEVTLHSWVDLVQNAIYLADGERVTVQPDMADLNLRYPNHGLFIQGIGGVNVIEAISAENPAIVNSKSMLARATSNDTDQYVQFQWDSTGMQGYLQEQVFSVNYWGFVKIHYTYFSGGTTKSMFTKSYIVYCEAWRRK